MVVGEFTTSPIFLGSGFVVKDFTTVRGKIDLYTEMKIRTVNVCKPYPVFRRLIFSIFRHVSTRSRRRTRVCVYTRVRERASVRKRRMKKEDLWRELLSFPLNPESKIDFHIRGCFQSRTRFVRKLFDHFSFRHAIFDGYIRSGRVGRGQVSI